jgi:hypothetical protein
MPDKLRTTSQRLHTILGKFCREKIAVSAKLAE